MRTVLAAAAVALGSAWPAHATDSGSWSFGFGAFGPVTTDTSNNLTPNTLTTTYTDAKVLNVSANAPAAIDILDPVGLTPTTFSYAPGLGDGPSAIEVIVEGIVWDFYQVHMIQHSNQFVAASWDGFVADGGGLTPDGSPAVLTQSCDQARPGAIIACSNTNLTTVTRIPEASSLMMLGTALLGFASIHRLRRRGQSR